MADRDKQIRSLERAIHERRLMLRDNVDELGQAALQARQRIRHKATSPLVWGGALVLGFIVARLARRNRGTPKMRVVEPRSPGRQVLAAVLSAALPVVLRVARYSAQPFIARMLQALRANMARRQAYGRAYGRP
jgi:hypothetical protein